LGEGERVGIFFLYSLYFRKSSFFFLFLLVYT
jgi:hypothetical protein